MIGGSARRAVGIDAIADHIPSLRAVAVRRRTATRTSATHVGIGGAVRYRGTDRLRTDSLEKHHVMILAQAHGARGGNCERIQDRCDVADDWAFSLGETDGRG